MLRYSIASLAKRPKGTTATLPRIEERSGSVRDYRVELNKMLRAMAKEVRENILPQISAERALARALSVQDGPEDRFEGLEALSVTLARVATDMVKRIIGLEAERHTDEFIRTAKRALGVDLAAVVRNEDLTDYLAEAAARNAGLIKGLADETQKRIKQRVSDAVINGESLRSLRKSLTEDFGIMANRAALIAADQVAKVNADLNEKRQQQAGIKEYRWRTSRDERVRERHRALEGKTYKWGEVTGAEGGLPPGKPIRCRCTAEGVVHF